MYQKPRRYDLVVGLGFCASCTGKCHHHFSLPFDSPHVQKDYEVIRWCMVHCKTTIFYQGDGRCLMIHERCYYLLPNNLFVFQETRQQIWRDYTTKECEYEDDWIYKCYLEISEQMQVFIGAVLAANTQQHPECSVPSIACAGLNRKFVVCL